MISTAYHNHSSIALARPTAVVSAASTAQGNTPATTSERTAAEDTPAGARPAGKTTAETTDASPDNPPTGANDRGELTEDQQREVEQLRARDREVRAHEQAHLAAAGQYARGGIQYTYERGPDQRMYAVGGQVSVDTAKVPGDPEATLRKAETLRRAALAPANPSSQDRSVASEMTRMAAEARLEMAEDDRAARDEALAVSSIGEESMGSGEGTDEALSAQDGVSAVCPTCGGKHSAGAHDAMVAYGGGNAPASPTLAMV